MKQILLSGDEEETEAEFFPASVLLILGLIGAIVYQLSRPSATTSATGGEVARGSSISSSAITTPISVKSLHRGVVATVSAVTGYARQSFFGRSALGAYITSYLVFIFIPALSGTPAIGPDVVGLRLSDITGAGHTVFPERLLRYVAHGLYVSPSSSSALANLCWWCGLIPATFYLFFALLENAFVGANTRTASIVPSTNVCSSRVAGPNPSSSDSNAANPSSSGGNSTLERGADSALQKIDLWWSSLLGLQLSSQLWDALELTLDVVVAQFMASSVILQLSQINPTIFKLRATTVHYGPESMLTSLWILLLYRNPIVYGELVNTPFPYPIESRWVALIVLSLLYGFISWPVMPAILIGGVVGGYLVVLKEWLSDHWDISKQTTSNRPRQTRIYTNLPNRSWIHLEFALYFLASVAIPFVAPMSIPSAIKALLAFAISPTAWWGLIKAPLAYLTESPDFTLWSIACSSGQTPRFLTKCAALILLSLPAVLKAEDSDDRDSSEENFATACRYLGALLTVQLLFAMSSPLWLINPHIGFPIQLCAIYRLLVVYPRKVYT